MRLCILFILCSLGAVVRTVFAQTPVLVLCPYTIAGRVVNFDGIAFDADDQITLYVRNTAGAVLAKTSVFDPGSPTAWNYRIEVPMASAAADGYAVSGDMLLLSVVDAKGTVYEGFLQGEDAVARSGGTVHLRLMLAEDANRNGIADLYEKSKEYDMYLKGIEGETFDPTKDYDRDGISNYNEYLAGTDPFDTNDFFRISGVTSLTKATDNKEIPDDLIAISFEANAGRTYIVNETPSIDGEKINWQRGAFRMDLNSAATVDRVTNDKQSWSIRTIYLLKNGPARFYRVEMEE